MEYENLNTKYKISIIVPCYNEEESILLFYKELSLTLRSVGYDYDLLFINDGSRDNTLALLKKIVDSDEHVRYISFSRNFGKEAAIYAGFCNVNGNYIAVMDADMQDPPSLLPKMIEIITTGDYDSVATRREDRKGEPVVRSWFAKIFYKIINKISDANIVDGARDFRLMTKEMVDVIVKMGEYNRFSKGIFGWIGFRTYWLSFENKERIAGKTKWNFGKLFKYAVDGIINFSQVPLDIVSWFGILMTILSFFFLVLIIIRKICFGDPVVGWASTMCVIIFIGGIQLFSLGIIGQYIAKIYMETKNRPHYIIAESSENDVVKVK